MDPLGSDGRQKGPFEDLGIGVAWEGAAQLLRATVRLKIWEAGVGNISL